MALTRLQPAALQPSAFSGLNITDGSLYPVDLSSGAPVWDVTGKLGIGVASPLAKLDVYADNATVNVANFRTTQAYNTTPEAYMLFGFKYNSSGGYADGTYISSGKENTTDGNTASYMRLWTRTNGSNPAERVRIDSSGQVGIGTSAPLARLHVQDGVGSANGTIRLGDGTYYGTIQQDAAVTGAMIYTISSASGGGHIWKRGSSEQMRIDTSGNLQVSTTTAASTNGTSAPGSLMFSGYGWNTSLGSVPAYTKLAPVFNYSGANSFYGQTTGGLQIKTISTAAGATEQTLYQIDGLGYAVTTSYANNTVKTATFAVTFSANPSSSNSYVFQTSTLGFTNAIYYHVEIDAGAYGNSNSGPGLYKALVSGYSGLGSGYKTSNIMVNTMTAGAWTLDLTTANQITITASNTDSVNSKFVTVRFTVTWQ